MAGWCPTCGSEWWVTPSTCPDCGTTLTAERPEQGLVPVSADETGTPIPLRDHELREFDLDHLTDAERWELWVRLDSAGIAHEWAGGTLRGPVEATDIVESVLSGSDASDDLEHTGRPAGTRRDEPTEFRLLGPRLARFIGGVIDIAVVRGVMLVIGGLWTTTTTTTTRSGTANGVGSYSLTTSTTGAVILAVAFGVLYDVIAIGRFGRTFGK